MNKQIRKLLLGLAIVLVSLTGLLAVSALVPDVGCQNRTPDMLETFTRIRVFLPDARRCRAVLHCKRHSRALQYSRGCFAPFWGKRDVGRALSPAEGHIKSTFLSAETITDDLGRFSCNVTTRVPGKYLVTAKYPGDSLMYYHDSADGREVEFVGEESVAKPVDLSWLRYTVVIPILLLGAYLLYRFLRTLNLKRRGEKGPSTRHGRWSELRDLVPWVIAAVVMAAILYALVPRGPAIRRQGEETNRIATSIRLTVPSRVDQAESFEVKGRLIYLQGERRAAHAGRQG